MTATTAMTPPAALAELGARALLGTDRAGDSPAEMLREAAMLGARSRAGWMPAQSRSVMPVCPADPVPVVSAACAGTLRRILAEKDAGLIQEWAELAAARLKRVPDTIVPALLEWCASQPKGMPQVFTVMGARAEWLCTLNPAWRKKNPARSLPEDLDAAWQTGTTPERIALLAAVRLAEPAAAERLVRATWSHDSADERRRFVEKFATGLSMHDEPFLEWTLDDRSKMVREAASELLSRLPGSRLAARMAERAAAMFSVEQVKKGLLRRTKDEVSLEPPKEWDAAWERDGLEEKPQGSIGKRAWWMMQVLSRTDPAALAARTGLSAETILSAVAGSDYAKHALAGLAAAAAAARNEDWCVLLVRHHRGAGSAAPQEIEALWKALTPPARESLFAEATRVKHVDLMQVLSLAAATAHPWSAGFTDSAVQILCRQKPLGKQHAWAVVQHLDSIARWVHPGERTLAAMEEFVRAALHDELPPSAIRCIDLVRVRTEMHKEFES